jgi:LmbE family N-acetylglucosaminyl deacetylase
LVAHPDDETAGCGVLLQRILDPIVVFATDGAPRSSFFWSAHASRESYGALRWSEAVRALRLAGRNHCHQLAEWNPIPDQELFLNLECAYESLSELIEDEHPQAVLTLAYEGGHPDHDCCSFLAAIAGRDFDLPVWEFPLYHRAEGVLSHQRFVAGDGLRIQPNDTELMRKRQMFAAYGSQASILTDFREEIESVRPAFQYDFSQPPHAGVLNYEAWGWPMGGADLSRAFSSFICNASHPARKRRWESAA